MSGPEGVVKSTELKKNWQGFSVHGKNHNWIGSSQFDFWQEHYHIVD